MRGLIPLPPLAGALAGHFHALASAAPGTLVALCHALGAARGATEAALVGGGEAPRRSRDWGLLAYAPEGSGLTWAYGCAGLLQRPRKAFDAGRGRTYALTLPQFEKGVRMVPYAVGFGAYTQPPAIRAPAGRVYAELLVGVRAQPPPPSRRVDTTTYVYPSPALPAGHVRASAAHAAATFAAEARLARVHAQTFAGNAHKYGRTVAKLTDALKLSVKTRQTNTAVVRLVPLSA